MVADLLDPPPPQPSVDATPGALAARLDPLNVQTRALALIDAALCEIDSGENDRLIISMPPQEGKSQRASRRFPTWKLLRDPDCRIAIVSYEHRTARRWGRVIRDDMITHDLLPIDSGVSAANEWQVAGHIGGVYSVGIGGALTGRPVDLLIIDDPIKDREQADSQTYRDSVWDWWTDVGISRLAPGAPVVLILTRWHEDDLAGRLLAAEDGHRWTVINIPAQADHKPELAQVDPLGRESGEWLDSARGRTEDQWEAIRIGVGSRTFTALYQGRPTPDSGDVLQREWWRRYITPPYEQMPDGTYRVDEMDSVLQSWDMAFKDTKTSDWVVGQVWCRRGTTAYLLDQVRGRLSFTNSVAAVRQMTAKWPQARLKLIEDKANGTAIIDTLKAEIGGIVAIEPHGSKYARANAISPFVEAGNVRVPEFDVALFEVEGLIDEAASFPNGANDDQVDALSQALYRLLYQRGGRPIFEDDDTDPFAKDLQAARDSGDVAPVAPVNRFYGGNTSTGLNPDQEANGKLAPSPFV